MAKKQDFCDGFMRAEDLIRDGVWAEWTLTIKAVHAPDTIKSPDGKSIDKPVIDFEETGKRFVLGRVNQRLLIYQIGTTKPADWVGSQVTIYPATGDWFGQKNVTTKRIRITGAKSRPFISPKNLGNDITGRRFANDTPKPVPPKPVEPVAELAKPASPGQQIAACQTVEELYLLIEIWVKARPVVENVESWQGIVPLIEAKMIDCDWNLIIGPMPGFVRKIKDALLPPVADDIDF